MYQNIKATQQLGYFNFSDSYPYFQNSLNHQTQTNISKSRSALNKQQLSKQKKFYLQKLKHQTQQIHQNIDHLNHKSNSPKQHTKNHLKSLPLQQKDISFSNQSSRKIIITNQDAKLSRFKLNENSEITKSKQIQALINQISQLKSQNTELKRVITQFNQISENYISVMNQIQRDLSLYKEQIRRRDKMIEQLRYGKTGKEEIQKESIQNVMNSEILIEKYRQLEQEFKVLKKQRDEFEQIIFEQECQNKFYRGYLQDYYNVHLRLERQKPKLLNKLENLRSFNTSD